ncbi:pregnancy zone protein-like isoform X3 [Patiria miniata]|uniref:EGF-like domain-containing protein n=1 Tax=Patiria miniata TaxID=46514 RepID=A0A914BTY0_PATMI|nr:pregnancy zone protein-like isoform X3 [Patiria miniata]
MVDQKKKDFKMILFLVAFVTLQGLVQSMPGYGHEEINGDEPPPYGYLVVSPRVLFSGKEESICATIQDTDEPVEVTLIFMENNVTEISRAPPFDVEFGTACGKVEIPAVEESPKTVILKAMMKRLSAAEPELVDQKKVAIFKQGSETYVQTDKPIYKPGQPIKFRVLTLDSDLKPDKTVASDIWVETPSGIRVAQWLNQSSPDALIDLELPMSSDPPLGDWKIVVVRDSERIERTFKVDEYVLPKFEITADLPPFILTNDEEFEVRICARYTYGQPVRGLYSADITIDEEYRSWYGNIEPRPILRFESADTGVSGCGTIIVSGEAMLLNYSDFSIWSSRLKVDVNFTEEATGVTLSETVLSKSGIITTDPLLITFKGPTTFKPGMPFDAWVVVTYPDGTPASGFEVKVNGMADYEDIYNGTFTSSENGMIHFVMDNIDIDTRDVTLFATVEGYANVRPYDPEDEDYYKYHYIYDPIGYHNAEASYSPSGSFVQVAPIDGKLSPGEEQEFTTHFTADPETVADLKWFFVFMSRSEILTVPVTAVEEAAPRKKRDIIFPYPETEVNITQPGSLYSRKDKFTVTSKMSPEVKLLVYYIRPDQEVVADSIKVDVQEVFDNKVSMAFANDEETPGGKALLKLSASEGSLCAVGIVDKSVYVLEDDKYRITKDKVFQKIREDQDRHTYYWLPNPSDHCPDEYPWWFYSGLDRRRRKRTSVPYPGGFGTFEDSSQAFEDMGLVFMSNLKVETRPCNTGGFPILYDSVAPGAELDRDAVAFENEISDSSAPTVRSFFPETWLWKLERIGDMGEAELDLDVPHTITEWVGNGFCLSAETGLGVADTATLRAFQPFFVSLTLPYSIIRGEEVGIKATVFNYLSDECMVIRISLIESDMFVVVDNTYEYRECVCAGASKTVEFKVKGLALGEMDIEVHAVSVADDEVLCGNEAGMFEQTGLSDGVRRKLLVEPEGIQHEYSIGKYFCPSELPFSSYNKRFQLATPPNTVPGSMRGRMTLTGDLMGQTISNLDNLLQIPTGCGEQNMLGFVPNIVAMQYLTKSGTLTDDLESKAKTNMRIGYMRELNYRHKDGSYSAFNDNDESGSTWLTAYVVRSFAQAADFITIDQNDLDVTIDWLKKQQNERGCFNRVGHLGHKAMAGGVNSEITLTAYVLTSLLVAGVAPEDPVIQNAQSCLELESDTLYDTYAAAQLAYAGALAGHPRAQAAINFLDSLAVREGNVQHWVSSRDDAADWDTYYRASKQSQEIEMTAYALLAFIQHMPPEDARVFGIPIVRWLVDQQSSRGGFSSTQDTVIGLQALAAYAGIINQGPVKMRVEVMERGRKVRQLELLERNKLVMQEVELNVPNLYTLRARGKGCGLVQFTVYYNMLPVTPPVAPFTLTKRSRNLDNDCKKFEINLCASYTGTGGANMVLAQVKLVTGYAPDPASINDLKSQTKMSQLKRVETDGKTLSFYIDKGLDETPVCWDFVATKEFNVKNAKPGTLNVFDYYEKDLAISDSLEFICQPMEEEMPEPGTPGESPIDPDIPPPLQPDETPLDPEISPPLPDESPLDPDFGVIPPGQPDEIDQPISPGKPAVDVDGDPIEKPGKPGKPVDDPSAKPEKPPIKPLVDPNAKPEKPPTKPVVDPTVSPVQPTTKPVVDSSAKPDMQTVDPLVDPSGKPYKPTVEPVVDPTTNPDKPTNMPVVDQTAKSEKPSVLPEVDPSVKPDKPTIEPDVEPATKPEKPPVVLEAPTAKPDKPVVPEEPTAKPDKPVVPDVEPTAKPDKPAVPKEEPTAKPDKSVVPEEEPTAKPDKPVVPEEEPTAKPDKPVVPEEEPTAKPDKPVVPEEEPTAKPDKPVVPEEEPTAKPDKPVVPEEEPTAKPDKPVVIEEPTAKPDKPVVIEEPTAKPDKPVVIEEPTAKPDKPVVIEEPTAKPDKPVVIEEPTAKPDKPVVPEEPTAKPDKPVVIEEPTAKPDKPDVPEEPTAKPDKPVVIEEPTAKPDKPDVPEEPTAKPDKPVVIEEPTAKPDKPVVPEEEPTAKPDKPVVPEEEPTAKPDIPVVPEEEPTAPPDIPVVPEEEPTAQPDKPVVPEKPTAKPDKPVVIEEPTAKPDKPVVIEEPTAKPDKPVVIEEPTAKPDKPVVIEEPTAKPDKPVVIEEPTAKPDKPVVIEEPTAKPDIPVVPEEEPTAPPDIPVVPEEEPTAQPDKPVVPEEPTAKPDKPVVIEEPTAKPDKPVVIEEPTAKPDKPVVPEEPTAKPDKPVVPEEEPTAKPDIPVVPEEEPTAPPDIPVVPEEEPTAQPDKPVVPEEPTAKPDKPVVIEEPTAKPDKPVVIEEPTAKPDKPVVIEEPTAKPDKPVVIEEPTAKPDKPVVIEEPTAKPDKPVVIEEPTAKPDKPVVPEEPTAKPDKPVVPEEPTAKPDKPVVAEEPTAKPSEPSTATTDQTAGSPALTTKATLPTTIPTTVPRTVPMTIPTTSPTPVVIIDTICILYPDICDFGVCVDDETRPSFYYCDCNPGFTEVSGHCVLATTLPPATTTTEVIIADTYCNLYPEVCGDGVCVDDESLPSTYRCDCELGYEEVEGTCADVDECTFEESCPGLNSVCTNFPGTYECNCEEGHQEDSEGNCFACPICSDTLPSGFEEKFCASDYVFGAKKRGDGTLRILLDLRMAENKVSETRYIKPTVNPQCICDELTYGDRVLIITSMDKVAIETMRRRTMETVDLGGAYIVPLKGSTKGQLVDARTSSCP